VYIQALVALTAAVCILSAGAPSASAQQLIQGYELGEPAFSPDGDSSQDTTSVTFTLGAPAALLSVIVFQQDSVTVVDTLIAPSALATGTHRTSWNGRAWDGSPVPEGLYLITLRANDGAQPDTTATLPVAVDNTAPQITVLGAEPGVYAPGLFGTPQVYTVTITISNSSAFYGLPHLADELAYSVTDPVGAAVTPDNDWFEPEYRGADTTLAYKWDASLMRTVDGFYELIFVVTDKAGHSGRVIHYANVDADGPDVEPINVTDGDKLSALPDSLFGWAWDRSGIDSLYARYSEESNFFQIDFTEGLNDTVLFGFPLADSITTDGDHKVTIRAKDAVAADTGRVTLRGISLTLDTAAPESPTLEPFDGVWQSSTFPLRAQWPGSPYLIRIYRNNEKIDSVFVVLNNSFERDVPLAPEQNVLTATSVDLSGNESRPSNEVRVYYDQESGLFIPAPFRPGNRFNINLARDAAEVTLRIFDLTGDVVIVTTDSTPGREFAFEWDGLNGDNIAVKKGPLVAVVEVRYEDGDSNVFREIFLFDPVGGNQ
jgi:flagellar hook assembly protein FlgD